MPPFTVDFLLQNSIPEPNSGCWLWAGKTLNSGYGRACKNGRDYTMHRVACEIVHGPLQKHAYACHRCNVRLCVNPSHIYPGDFYSNMRDMAASGTQKGSRNPSARMTAEDILAIRVDERPVRVIAADYGVTVSNIYAIKTRRSWRHI